MSSRCPHPIELSRAATTNTMVSASLQAHLDTCARCTAELESHRNVADDTRILPAIEPDADHTRVLRAAILTAARTAPSTTPRRFWMFGVAAATALAAAAAIFLLVRNPQQPSYRGAIHAHDGAQYVRVAAGPDEIVRLTEGTLTVEVSPLAPEERFRVITGDGEVEVRGTMFDVSASADKLVAVRVMHGKVEVRASGAAPKLLVEGERWDMKLAAIESATGTASNNVAAPGSGEITSTPGSGDIRSADVRPGDVRPGDRSGEVRSGEVRSADQSGDVRSRDVRSGEVRSGEGSGDVRSGDVRSGDVRSGEVRSADRPGNVRTGEVRSGGDAKPGTNRDATASVTRQATGRDAPPNIARNATRATDRDTAGGADRDATSSTRVTNSTGRNAPRDNRASPAITLDTTQRAATNGAPKRPIEVLFDRGWAALAAGKPREAATAFEHAASSAPSDPLAEDAWFWRATALARAKSGDAASALEQFLGRYPRSNRAGEASAMLGWIVIANDLDRAEKLFTSAAKDRVPAVRASGEKGLAAIAKRRAQR
jgi:TolA-binding protein